MPHRKLLLDQLRIHRPFDEREGEALLRLIRFVEENPQCFERSLLSGHVTASGWVISRDRSRTLLTHHAKLDRWLQMGGHCDGDADTCHVALREVREESGLVRIIPLTESIFDVDVHQIPERGPEPAHFHYDVRYLFLAEPTERLAPTNESKDLRWIALNEVERLNTDDSVLRLVRRTPCILDSSVSCLHT